MALPSQLDITDAAFLDFDGTLVEIAAHPGEVVARAELIELLETMRRRLADALALVSGRSIADLDARLAPFRSAAVGLHGIELRAAPRAPVAHAPTPALAGMVAELQQAVAAMPGVWVEDKGAGAAIHCRAAPQTFADCDRLAAAVAARHGLHLLHGKMVVELRPPGINKGAAVATLMDSPAFRHRRPIFVGDDVADEDGFAVVQSLGGIGVKVGDGSSIAFERCADVSAVLAWFRRALA